MKTGISNDSERAFAPPLKGYLLEVKMILLSEIDSPNCPLIRSSCNNWYQAVPVSINTAEFLPIRRVAFASW